MSVYTVHTPPGASDLTIRAERTIFVRDGFSFVAFVFGWFYLVWHRMWGAAILWLAAVAVLAAGFAYALHVPPGPLLAVYALMHLFLGLEGRDLRRWQLERRRFQFADVVAGAGREEAEYVFFHRQPEEAERSSVAVSSRVVARDTTPTVIGMFPDETAR